MTDSNRADAQAGEQVIAEFYGNKTLWTTDWDGLQLKRCVSVRKASTDSQLGFRLESTSTEAHPGGLLAQQS